MPCSAIRKGGGFVIKKRGIIRGIPQLLLPPILIALCTLLLFSSGSLALEGSGSHYFGGNEDFSVGNAPPPGLSLNFSMLNFNYDRLKGNDGHTISVPGGYGVDGLSNSLRIIYITKINLLGGSLGWFLTPAIVYQHVRSGGRTQSKTEMGDLNFGVVLKRDFKTFYHVIGTDVFAPTGVYDKDDLCNIGVNYWTLGPTYAFTYLGDMDSPVPGFEVSARFAYYFHTTNHATGYTSGQEFSFDYLVGQRLGKNGWFRIGANGHYAYQVTDDTYRNQPATFDGYKARQFTIGPAVQFAIGNAPVPPLMTLKVQWGVYNVNHGEGNNLWLKFWYPF
jgi:hypothetical protein